MDYWLRMAILAWSIGLLGYTALLNCARSPLVAVSIFQLLLPLRREPPCGILLASFVTQVLVGDVNSVQRKTRGLANCRRLDGRAKAYILKQYRWYCACFWRRTPEAPLTTMSGHHLGSADCWLCQHLHQIFGGDPSGYPRLRVEPVWVTSS